MDELISKEVIDKILNELGETGVALFKERVYLQRQVDGNPFPPLAQSTIKTKKVEVVGLLIMHTRGL